MTDSPWNTARLADSFEVVAGNPAPKNVVPCSGDVVPFVRVQDLGRQGSAAYIHETKDALPRGGAGSLRLFPKGTVLFTKSGMSTLLNQRAILARPMYVVGHIGAVLPSENASPEWVYYWLKQVDLGQLAHATTLPSLPLAKVRELEIPLPPKSVQGKIVEALDSYFSRLDEVEAGLERVQRNLKRYRASVLQAAVTGRLVPTEAELARAEGREYEPASELLKRILVERRRRWEEAGKRGKYQEPTPPDTSNLPELPEGWCWARLAAIAGLLNGDRGKNYPSRAHYVADGVPFITAGALAEGVIDRTRLNFIPEQRFDLLRAGRVLDGDLLYCLRGSLGKSAIVRGLARGAIASSLLIVRLHREVSATYARTVLQSPWGDRLIRESDNGTAQPNLSAESVASFPIPLPPRLEIVRIAAELDRQNSVLTKQEEAAERGRNRCRELRSRILGQAFEGRIGVQISSEHRQWLEKGRPGLHASLDSPVKATPGGHQGGGLDGNG